MTGQELFEALSFVDARYIDEAETARLGRNVPWMKLLSVAACLCILMVGALALGEFGHKGAAETEIVTEAAEEEAVAEAAAAPEAADRQEAGGAAAETAAGEVYHVPAVTLRIVSVEDDRWTAVVEEISDEATVLEVGMQVTVVIDTDSVSATSKEDNAMFGGILLPEEGLLAKIENGAYDAGANILYVTDVDLEEPVEEG